MVALAQYIPDDPVEQESVLAVLREHPALQEFILRASAKAEEIFPEINITLDTVRYDDWDPPVSMTIAVVQPLEAFSVAHREYIDWLVSNPDFRRDLITVMPIWRRRPDERS